MEAVTDEVKTPTLSHERKEELRDELDDLVQRKTEELSAIAEGTSSINEATANLERIQEEERVILQELMDDESISQEPIELTPEMADEAINAIKAEFDKGADGAKEAGYVVQEGLDFAAVEAKLREEGNEEALTSLYRMVQAGSRPAVVCEEDGRFCILETFGQILEQRANCVYDRKAERQVGRENCNGNAVTQAKAMGVPLAERRIANAHLTAFPDSDQYCYDYIQATEDERKRGRAPCACRRRGGAGVGLRGARSPGVDRGWRGALWV